MCHSAAMSHGTSSVESVIRGHHVYKDVWLPVISEDLMCQRELGNPRNLFAVSVLKTAPSLATCLVRYLQFAPYFYRWVVQLAAL